MPFPADAGLVAVLTHFDVSPGDVLGHGGEAWVYALDATRVVRVLHAGATLGQVEPRYRLIGELARARPAFALPEMLDAGELGGRVYMVERRLPGRTVMDELSDAEGERRTRLVEAHLAAAAALGDLHLDARSCYGELLGDAPVTASTWHAFLQRKAEANLRMSDPSLAAAIDVAAVVGQLPDATEARFVHLDAFAGNMLTDGERITAVLDIGPTSVSGDRRLDPLACAVYLTAPEITPTARSSDGPVVRRWLVGAGLDQWFEPARQWLAAFWSFAVDDPRVLRWCRRILLREA